MTLTNEEKDRIYILIRLNQISKQILELQRERKVLIKGLLAKPAQFQLNGNDDYPV